MSILDALPLFDFMYIHQIRRLYHLLQKRDKNLRQKTQKKSKAITHSLDTAFLDMLVDISS